MTPVYSTLLALLCWRRTGAPPVSDQFSALLGFTPAGGGSPAHRGRGLTRRALVTSSRPGSAVVQPLELGSRDGATLILNLWPVVRRVQAGAAVAG